MIVLATADFRLYHAAVDELRERGTPFTTVQPGEDLPEGTAVVVSAATDDPAVPAGVAHVVGDADAPRRAVEEALAALRDGGGRTVVGVDPGDRPGIAVLSGETVVAAFQVPLGDAVGTVREQLADAADPLVRVGDGARLAGARVVDALDDVPVELVDETGTTPSLGTGARGMGDVLAAVNIARMEGERVDTRAVEPTPGELQVIKDRSRERSGGNRAIDDALARRVAVGELSVGEALALHRGDADRSGQGDDGPSDDEHGSGDDRVHDAEDDDRIHDAEGDDRVHDAEDDDRIHDAEGDDRVHNDDGDGDPNSEVGQSREER